MVNVLKMIILRPDGKHVSYLPLVGNVQEKKFCFIFLVVLSVLFPFDKETLYISIYVTFHSF